MDIKKIGEFIKEQRLKKGYTQTELSKILGVSHQAVSRWENGENLPDVVKLNELGTLFGVSVDYIIKCGLEDNGNQASENNLGFFILINGIFTVISVFLYYLLMFATRTYWIPVLTQYIIVIASSLLYIIPYANIKNKTSNDFGKVRVGLLFTLGSLIYTVNTFFVNGLYYEDVMISALGWGTLLVPTLYLINIFLKYYENKTFNDSTVKLKSYFNERLLKYTGLYGIGIIVFMAFGFGMDILTPDIDEAFFTFIQVSSIAVGVINIAILIKKFNYINLFIGIANLVLIYHLFAIINMSDVHFTPARWSVIEDVEYWLIFSATLLLFISFLLLVFKKAKKLTFDSSFYLLLVIYITILSTRLSGIEAYFYSSDNGVNTSGVYYRMGFNYVPLTIIIFIIIWSIDYVIGKVKLKNF
ncbi:MAG: helix-turn-helix domain-containing protein [Candidatus Izemoplasmataceae bacterium]